MKLSLEFEVMAKVQEHLNLHLRVRLISQSMGQLEVEAVEEVALLKEEVLAEQVLSYLLYQLLVSKP